MIKVYIFGILFNLAFFLPHVQAQFGSLLLVDPDLSTIQPLNSNLTYTFELKYDALASSGPDNVDPSTIDLTAIPANGIQVISGPSLSGDLCTIILEFIPLIDQVDIIVCADDDSPFTQGSAALFRSGPLDVTDCPLDLELNSSIIPDNQYVAFQTIESNGYVFVGAEVSFQAGNCIELNEGFQVFPYAKFEAIISPGCN